MHPIAGTWTANLAKSKRHENHQFARSYGGVNHSGANESAAHAMHADGVERPVPQAPGVVSVCRWSGPRTLESIGKKDGAELTATVKGVERYFFSSP